MKSIEFPINRAEDEPLIESRPGVWLRRYGVVLITYLLATWFTDADFMGDTIDYVASVVARRHGLNYFFWEFAHLLWRPLGWVVSLIATPLTRLIWGANEYANVTAQLLVISWLAGMLIVILTRDLSGRLFKREWVANVVTIAFIFSHGFLNHAQSAAAYVPGLALLVLSIYILLTNAEKPEHYIRTAVFAAVALAGSVFMWVTYVLVAPAVLLSPLFVVGFDKRRLRLVMMTSILCGVVIGVVYLSVVAHLGIHDLTKLRAWVSASAEGAFLPRGGIPRTVFGLARSIINMGNDGVLFKRFLLHDPLNPVTLSSLFRISLWKLALFYLFLGSIIINLVRGTEGRRLLGLLIVAGIPVMALALLLEGGAVDRYLPLFPFIFLCLGYSLSSRRSVTALNGIALVFVGVMIITNASVLASNVIMRQQNVAAARIRELQPQLNPQSIVLAVNLRDELVNFNRSFPLNSINLDRDHPLHVASIITPGSEGVSWWRRAFAIEVLKVWKGGGEVWLSKRALSEHPKPEWDWVERDDPRVGWTDIYSFFSQFDVGQSLGGEDGFVLVAHSPKNEEVLRKLAVEKQSSSD